MRISVDNRFGSGAGWPPALQVQETIEDVAAILGRHLGTSVQLPDELHVLPGSPRTHTCAGTLPAKIEVGSEDAFAIIHQAPHEMGHVVANIWKLPCWNVTKNHWFEEAVCGALPALVYAEIGAGAAFRHVVTQASAHNASDRYLSWVDGHAAKYGSPSVSWSQAENWFLSRQIQIEANPTFDMAAPPLARHRH